MNLSIAHLLYINTSKDYSLKDYYPFGMVMPERNFSYENYKFGFNGKENDNEVKGIGNHQDYGMRVYDTRLSRFLSVDPLAKEYPWYSPYHFAGNSPIQAVDLDGLEIYYAADGSYIGVYGESTEIRVVNQDAVQSMTNALANPADNAIYFAPSTSMLFSESYNSERHDFQAPQMIIRVTRDIETDNSTTSTFKTETTSTFREPTIVPPSLYSFESVTGFILEPAGPSTTVSKQDKRIPTGMYNIVEHSGTSFQNVPKLFNDDVPQSRLILIHPGNYPDNTSGCMLPGSSRGTDYVGSSKVKSNEINNQIEEVGYEKVGVLIQENFPNE